MTAQPTRSGKWLGLLFATLALGFWGHDCYRSTTKTGLYRADYQGTVVKLRPTVMHLFELFDDHERSSLDDEVNRGRYSATLTGDDGATFEVGLSWRDFTRATAPGYLVCHHGKVSVYASRADAVAAGAVAP